METGYENFQAAGGAGEVVLTIIFVYTPNLNNVFTTIFFVNFLSQSRC